MIFLFCGRPRLWSLCCLCAWRPSFATGLPELLSRPPNEGGVPSPYVLVGDAAYSGNDRVITPSQMTISGARTRIPSVSSIHQSEWQLRGLSGFLFVVGVFCGEDCGSLCEKISLSSRHWSFSTTFARNDVTTRKWFVYLIQVTLAYNQVVRMSSKCAVAPGRVRKVDGRAHAFRTGKQWTTS